MVVVVVAAGRVVVVVVGGFVRLVAVTPSPGWAPAVVGETAGPAEQAASNSVPASRVPAVRHRRSLITKTITVAPSNLVPCQSVSVVTVC